MPSIKTISAGLSDVNAASTTPTNIAASLTIVLRYTDNTPAVGIPASAVVITATGANNTIVQPTGVSNALGEIFGASYTATTSGARTITVTVGGLALTDAPGITVGSASLVFESQWTNSLGQSDAALTDGGLWANVANCGYSAPNRVIEVVTAASASWSGAGDVFNVELRDVPPEAGCGYVEAPNVVPESTTHFGRLYYRNAETALESQHNFSYNFLGPIQFIFFNRLGRADGWTTDVRLPASFPYTNWRPQTGPGVDVFDPPLIVLDSNAWYRYEWSVEYLTATTMRFYPRLYDNTNTLIADQNNYYQMSTPTQGTFTLATWYAAGNSFTVSSPSLARNIGIGNEGRNPGSATGQWFVADFALSTSGWVGA